MNARTSLESLAKALSAAQGELGDAAKSSFNPGFKSKYADLAEVLQTIRPVAAKNGLSFVQGVGYDPERKVAIVTTRLMHVSGQFLEDTLHVPVTKVDAQGLGSALTYGRRYAIAAMFGIAQDDDDGNGAVAKGKAEHRTTASESVESLTKAFTAAVTPADLERLAKQFGQMTAAEQTALMIPAKAARERISALGKS